MYKNHIKRWFDFTFALVVAIILLPVFVLLAIVLFISLGENPFFTQRRPGKNARIFTLLKFKTMKNTRDANGNLLPDSRRITKIGSIVRKSSLDELPQLLNVLIGDMSLIGPRPLLEEYLPLYSARQARRHEVRPGITGWTGVNGRNSISWHDKFELDIWYVDNISFRLDIKIFFLTFVKIFKREGITANNNSVSIDKFNGRN